MVTSLASTCRGNGNCLNVSEGSVLNGWQRIVSPEVIGHLIIGGGSCRGKGIGSGGIVTGSVLVTLSLSLSWGHRHVRCVMMSVLKCCDRFLSGKSVLLLCHFLVQKYYFL